MSTRFLLLIKQLYTSFLCFKFTDEFSVGSYYSLLYYSRLLRHDDQSLQGILPVHPFARNFRGNVLRYDLHPSRVNSRPILYNETCLGYGPRRQRCSHWRHRLPHNVESIAVSGGLWLGCPNRWLYHAGVGDLCQPHDQRICSTASKEIIPPRSFQAAGLPFYERWLSDRSAGCVWPNILHLQLLSLARHG